MYSTGIAFNMFPAEEEMATKGVHVRLFIDTGSLFPVLMQELSDT